MRFIVVILLGCFGVDHVWAEVQTKTVVYRDGDVELEGFIAWNDQQQAQAPGVLIVHQWLGLTNYEKGRAKQLAELGYVAMALDVYGKGLRPADVKEASEFAAKYRGDRALFRKRLNLGLDQLKAQANVDASRLVAIGYCFGGTGVLELARSGADLRGAVSFHGGLDSPKPEDGKNIQCKLLICHGADDPFVPSENIDAMKKELNEAKVDWQMIYYSHAVHSFTQPMAGNDHSAGAAYNDLADKRSWKAMRDFFDEVLGPTGE